MKDKTRKLSRHLKSHQTEVGKSLDIILQNLMKIFLKDC